MDLIPLLNCVVSEASLCTFTVLAVSCVVFWSCFGFGVFFCDLLKT